MVINKHSIIKEIFFVIFLILLGAFFIYVYNSALSSEQKIFQQIQNAKVKEYSEVFENFKYHLIQGHKVKTRKDIFKLMQNKAKRHLCENSLSMLNTQEIQYIYILQKDKRGRFRFLLDASKNDKAHFYQKFDVSNIGYEKLYKTKKQQIIHQKDIENLYLTLLYPIIIENEIVAIASIDISTQFQSEISNTIASFKILFKFLIILIFLVIVVITIYILHYYRSRKKLFRDPLTQVFNRHYLEEIKSSLNLNNYAIAMLDLDKFKIINDTYGHKAGDYVLHQSAQIIKKSLRDNDIIIRFGGEEFLVFLYTRGDIQSALNISNRIRENILKNIFTFEMHEILVSVSIGLNKQPSESKNLNDAIKLADTKLYIAKKNGRNQVVSSMDRRINIADDSKTKDIHFVKNALDDQRVVCYFQPIYDVKKNEIIKYEALVRIIDIDGSIISPFFFLPQIEKTNIHFRLTKEIFNICFEAAKHIDKSLSINMNYSDLINQDLENIILENLKDNKELASKITFEILESDEIENIDLFNEKVELLHSLGATISIDDFGSGYSNFKTVLDMNADFLKIDGTLVKDIDVDEKSYKVVKNIIQFAKDTKMKTIAEYVYSKEVYDKIVELDVDYVQGYYISEPKAIM